MEKIKIVVLDASPANDGDLSWQKLEAMGDLSVYSRTSKDELIERCKDAQVVFSNKVPFDDATFASLPKLKFLGVLATGYNLIDIESARKHGVTVCNVPAYSTDSVAQHVFALLLEVTNRVGQYSESVKSGEWKKCLSFSYRLCAIPELNGKTMGIIGFGNIGSRVAEIAKAFGMNVITTSSRELPEWVKRVSLEELMSESDVVSLNSALVPETYHIINEKTLGMMRQNAILINTARGQLVDEEALAKALNRGQIAGAGLDVLEQEPPRNGTPLIGALNCFITPHVAWQSTEARHRLMEISVENLSDFLEGKPQNVVG